MPISMSRTSGAAKLSAMTAVSTASAKPAHVQQTVAVQERRQVQHEAGRVAGFAAPHRLGRRAAAQQQQPVQAVGQADVQAGRQRGGGDRVDPGLRGDRQGHRPCARRQRRQRGGGRVVPGRRQRYRPRRGVGSAARLGPPHPHAMPGPVERGPMGFHGREAKPGTNRADSAFCVTAASRPQNLGDNLFCAGDREPPGNGAGASSCYRMLDQTTGAAYMSRHEYRHMAIHQVATAAKSARTLRATAITRKGACGRGSPRKRRWVLYARPGGSQRRAAGVACLAALHHRHAAAGDRPQALAEAASGEPDRHPARLPAAGA